MMERMYKKNERESSYPLILSVDVSRHLETDHDECHAILVLHIFFGVDFRFGKISGGDFSQRFSLVESVFESNHGLRLEYLLCLG